MEFIIYHKTEFYLILKIILLKQQKKIFYEVINEQLKELFEEKNNKTEEVEKTEDTEEKQPIEEEKVEKKSKKTSKK